MDMENRFFVCHTCCFYVKVIHVSGLIFKLKRIIHLRGDRIDGLSHF